MTASRLYAAALTLAMLLLTVAAGSAAAAEPTPATPIRAAFYYPWYPETWHDHGGPPIRFQPSLGHYSSEDPALQAAHIRSLDYAGMDAAISEWTQPPHYRDTRLQQLMARTTALGSPLKWAVYYTPEDKGDPSPDAIAADLRYIRGTLARSPAYLQVGGRPVVFVWTNAPGDASCALTDRWRAADALSGGGAYVVQKVFRGYRDCPAQPQAWHQYGPASPTHSVPGQSFSVSPGHWRFNEDQPRLARDANRFRTNVQQMVASGAPWQLVTTFNEWSAGTSVESAAEWRSPSGQGVYLDILHAALRGTSPTGGTPGQGGGGSPTGPRDRSGPRMSISSRALIATRAGRVPISLGCPLAETLGCRGTVRLVTAGRFAPGKIQAAPRRRLRLGTAGFRIGGGQTRTITIRLSRRGRTLVRERDRLRVRAIVTASDSSGNHRTTVKRLDLRSGGR